MAIKIGIFDHISRPQGVPLGKLYEDRIRLLKKADCAGFYCYHLAEHHGHNLATAPSQPVFLAALARETETLRVGTLVSCLPLHHPLRLVEEICMVDQLSGGRLELGVGRGVSPFEHSFFGHDPAEAKARFEETLDMVLQGLTSGRIDCEGRSFYSFPEAEVSLEPFQKPYPALWYPGNLDFAARHGFNFLSGKVTKRVRDRYDELWEEGRGDPFRVNPHVTEPLVGSAQFLCIAETEAEAERITDRAQGAMGGMVRKSDGVLPPHLQGVSGPAPYAPSGNLDLASAEAEMFVHGTPESVRDYYVEYASEGNTNYIVIKVPWGDMTIEEGERTLDLFIDEVLPAVRAATEPAAVPAA